MMGRWLEQTLPEGAKIGFHSLTMPYQEWYELQTVMNKSKQTLVPVNENLVDSIWTNRTSIVENPLIPLELNYTGQYYFEFCVGLESVLDTSFLYQEKTVHQKFNEFALKWKRVE